MPFERIKKTTHLREVACVRAVVSQELGPHGHGFGGVVLKVSAVAEEAPLAPPVRVEVAPILVTDAHVPLTLAVVTAC